MKILQQSINDLDGTVIDGETVFRLYDTYGFPMDLTADVAREKGLEIDEAGFEKAMQEQKTRARSSSQFKMGESEIVLDDVAETVFQGYTEATGEASIQSLILDNQPVDKISSGQSAMIVLDSTPFYGESGGQVGDSGYLESDGARFQVTDTQKQNGVFMHLGTLDSGELQLGQKVQLSIDQERREAIKLNHSATHLMHEALRQILGDHVQQKGSLVDDEKLRFDFSHYQPVTNHELESIEQWVNAQIRLNKPTQAQVMSIDDARETGAMMLFGEKYGEEVRVLSIGTDSVELCGGTHVEASGDIGLFKITLETGVASGVRRIEAVTGQSALNRFIESENTLGNIAESLKTSKEDIKDKVSQLQQQQKQLEKEVERLKSKLASQAGGDLAAQAVDVEGIKVLAAKLEGADVKSLRETVDQLKNKLGSAAIVLGTSNGEKVTLIAGVTADLTQKVKAGDLVNSVAQQCGGKGGGRPDMAQAGGSQPENLDTALSSVTDWVKSQL